MQGHYSSKSQEHIDCSSNLSSSASPVLGRVDVLPFVEVDLKKIVSRFIQRARENRKIKKIVSRVIQRARVSASPNCLTPWWRVGGGGGQGWEGRGGIKGGGGAGGGDREEVVEGEEVDGDHCKEEEEDQAEP
ncbi:hypothetical protein QJS10_CPA09g00798 [Acorus calamus]|uniref:Uncharacterized protein n=1 Tax=Acorus calamus TaxID=4465 RepID=A0AAV9E950_ACOCL|nr:hypothetical protein QJS10_CPA09g00798 [Acorus calamus]